MKVKFHKSFVKDYNRADLKVKSAFEKRLGIFFKNPYHISLKNHPLVGAWQGYRSVSITGDFRAVYKASGETAIFVALGTHSKLYD